MNKQYYNANKNWVEYYVSVNEWKNAWYYFEKMIKSIFE